MNTEQSNPILTGVIYKQILIFFFPILVGSFFQQLYSTADAVIVGRFIGKEALASVVSTSYIINIILGFFIGLSAGSSVIISQFFGSMNQKKLSQGVHTSIALSLACGFIVMIIGVFTSPLILQLMKAPADLMPFALTYLRVYFMGAIPIVVYNMGASILRAVGDSKTPLYVLILCTFCNICLDIFFIAFLKMGVFGAGLATALSQLISAIIMLVILMRSELGYRLDIRKIRFHRKVLLNMLKLGLPAGFQTTLYNFSNLIVQAALNSFGTIVLASWGAFTNIDNFYWMMIGAFGVSITTFSGQNFGAKKFDRIKQGVRVSLFLSAISSIIISFLYYYFSDELLSLFTNDRVVIENGTYFMRHYCQFYIFFIGIEILSGAIRGVGDSVIPTIITAIGICVVRISWIWFVLPLKRDIDTLLFTYPMTWLLTSIVFAIYYLSGGWLKRQKELMGFE